ncbi:hypothetical protein TWF481_004348 [Arthrobotrys musiformis]|uniref:MYND-type domain-containing protein n=1 Tax=Arthrobotrys musiformis TaxID=47236 RepID=A0AAV9WJB7_9PEZI
MFFQYILFKIKFIILNSRLILTNILNILWKSKDPEAAAALRPIKKMPAKRLQPACNTCGAISNLFSCGKCSAVQYCSVAHETKDAKRHGPLCSRIWERISLVRQCEELPAHYILQQNDPIHAMVPVDSVFPVNFNHGVSASSLENCLRSSLINIFIKQNTHASLALAIEQMRMLARDRLTSPVLFVPTLLRMGADGICYNLLSIERRLEVYGPRGMLNDDNLPAGMQKLHTEAHKVIGREEPGCDVFEDLKQWVLWSPMPPPKSMVGLVLVLKVWIDDLENAVQFDRTIAPSLRRKLNYDTVEIIRGYLFDSQVMIGNRKVLHGRAEKVLEELRRHQDYVLKASCYSNSDFWEQLILGVKSGIIYGNVGTLRERSTFRSTPGYTLEDLSVFRRLLQDDTSAFRFLTDFFEREPLYAKGPSGGLGWVKVWQEVSRLTTARSDALQNHGS